MKTKLLSSGLLLMALTSSLLAPARANEAGGPGLMVAELFSLSTADTSEPERDRGRSAAESRTSKARAADTELTAVPTPAPEAAGTAGTSRRR